VVSMPVSGSLTTLAVEPAAEEALPVGEEGREGGKFLATMCVRRMCFFHILLSLPPSLPPYLPTYLRYKLHEA